MGPTKSGTAMAVTRDVRGDWFPGLMSFGQLCLISLEGQGHFLLSQSKATPAGFMNFFSYRIPLLLRVSLNPQVRPL